MRSRINPCYDEKTHTSCSDRRAGCGGTCEKWAAYVEKRNKEYKEAYEARKANALMNHDIYEKVMKSKKIRKKGRNRHRDE